LSAKSDAQAQARGRARQNHYITRGGPDQGNQHSTQGQTQQRQPIGQYGRPQNLSSRQLDGNLATYRKFLGGAKLQTTGLRRAAKTGTQAK
jgi:hypothetical protein